MPIDKRRFLLPVLLTLSAVSVPSAALSGGGEALDESNVEDRIDARGDRRVDRRDIREERRDDRTDVRAQRRDCVGADCRQDARQERRVEHHDRAEERSDGRRERIGERVD